MNPAEFKSIVLGGGTAGLLAAISLKRGFAAADVKVVRSREIGVIRVGESTTPTFPWFLHQVLGLSPKVFFERARPTWKLGIRFLWGPRGEFNYAFATQLDSQKPDLPRSNGFYCHDDFTDVNLPSALMSRRKVFPIDAEGRMRMDAFTPAYHLENERLVEFLEWQARELGIELIDDTLEQATTDGENIKELYLRSGRRLSADLYVDASGFAALLVGKALGEPFVDYSDALFCDRAVVASRAYEPGESIDPFTTAETYSSGWCWRIDHDDRCNRGYVYSSKYLSDEQAELEFRSKNPPMKDSRVVKYRTGRRRRLWVGNVVAVGNSGGFVEPLEATALMLLSAQCRFMVQNLIDSQLEMSDAMRSLHNRFMLNHWDDTRNFLALHYRFNTRLDTPFWKDCRNVPLHGATELVDFYQVHGPSRLPRGVLLSENNLFGLDGHLALLVGMRVPYQRIYQPTEPERIRWHEHKQRNREMADKAVTVRQALAALRQNSAANHGPQVQPPSSPAAMA
jgi:tryptophan halogenase